MKKIVLFALMLLFLTPVIFAEEYVIVNSEDWRDVYSAMLYGSLSGRGVSFLVSDRHSTLILGSIPKETSIIAMSSRKSPFIIGYGAVLENSGYDTEEVVYDGFNLEVARLLDVENYIIVDDSYGYNAVSVAPYAVVSDSYVLFADRGNIREIDSFLSERNVGNLLIYGNVDRQVKEALARYDPEIINKDGDRFANNIEIVKKYQKIKNAKQVMLTNGEFIEKEVMSGAEPVIFIGANNVPDQVRDYIQSTDIEIGVLVGNELVGTATYIRRNVGISVFVKFAQGARAPKGAISQVEALDMFYLPVYSLNIEVDSIKYNKATNQLEVNIKNTEDQAVYFKGTYSIMGDGAEQKVGDIDPIFLDGNEIKTVVYDLEPITGEEIRADVYIIYGESKGSMEKVIDLSMTIELVEIYDKCEISLNDLRYNKRKGVFYIEVENTADVDCYVDVELVDLLINSETRSFSADDVLLLKPGEKNKQRIKAKLEEEDIEDNDIINARAYYGERSDSLVKLIEAEFELAFEDIDYVSYSLLLIIILLILLIIWRRYQNRKERKKKKRS
ncbi:hypothetical protein KY366_02595 [Candidatus Woesearchaeota archaeon]|nr:hypothetical protein [Candidatus Woesearchaeota archaeon]